MHTETRAFDFEKVNEILASLAHTATCFFDEHNIAQEDRDYRFYLEGRYPYQVWEIPMRIDEFLNDQWALDAKNLQ